MRALVSDGRRETKTHLRLWLLLGLAAGLLAFCSSTQVGLGWDEPEYIRAGTAYTYWFTDAPDRLSDQSVRDFWTWQHTHPPFGQLLAGIMVRLLAGLRLPLLSTVGIITAARIAPALFFGGTVALLAGWCERELGTRTAFLAGVSLVLFPRVFGAAQFVSLDVPMMFTWLLVVAAWEWALRASPPSYPDRPEGRSLQAGRDRSSCLSGHLRAVLAPRALLAAGALGLALLTKLNAFFLPLFLWPWALLRYRRRASGPILASLLLAPPIFLLGWPWLYHDTVARTASYLLDKVGRPVLPVYYLGQAYVEQYAPWHYPLVMLAVTVPAGLLAASVVGLYVTLKGRRGGTGTRTASAREGSRGAPPQAWHPWHPAPASGWRAPASGWRAPAGEVGDPAPVTELALVNFTGILLVAMVPWAPRYDGVRLFLPAFAFLAVLTGIGLDAMFRWAGDLELRWRRVRLGAVVVFLLTQGVGLIWAWPFHLTYYNMGVPALRLAARAGGLRGAERLGFESIYWGEAFDPQAWGALERLVSRETRPVAGVSVSRRARIAFVGVAKDVPEFLQRYGYLSDSFVPLGPQDRDFDYAVVARREGSLAREGWSGALEPRVLAKALFVREHHGVALCWIVRRADVE